MSIIPVEPSQENAAGEAVKWVVADHGCIEILKTNAGVTRGNAPTPELVTAVRSRYFEAVPAAPFFALPRRCDSDFLAAL